MRPNESAQQAAGLSPRPITFGARPGTAHRLADQAAAGDLGPLPLGLRSPELVLPFLWASGTLTESAESAGRCLLIGPGTRARGQLSSKDPRWVDALAFSPGLSGRLPERETGL